MSLIPRILISLVLCACVLFGAVKLFGVLAAMKEEPERGAVPPPRVAVKVMSVRRGPYQHRVRGYGRARALRRSDVAAEVPGLVLRVDPRHRAHGSICKDYQHHACPDGRSHQLGLSAV